MIALFSTDMEPSPADVVSGMIGDGAQPYMGAGMQ
jgi:hypothetical protein